MGKGEYKRKEDRKEISLAKAFKGETSPHLRQINASCIPGPDEDTSQSKRCHLEGYKEKND